MAEKNVGGVQGTLFDVEGSAKSYSRTMMNDYANPMARIFSQMRKDASAIETSMKNAANSWAKVQASGGGGGSGFGGSSNRFGGPSGGTGGVGSAPPIMPPNGGGSGNGPMNGGRSSITMSGLTNASDVMVRSLGATQAAFVLGGSRLNYSGQKWFGAPYGGLSAGDIMQGQSTLMSTGITSSAQLQALSNNAQNVARANPGMSFSQSAQTIASSYQPGTINAGRMMGLNIRGMTPSQMATAITNRLNISGKKNTLDQVNRALGPGGQLDFAMSQLGLDGDTQQAVSQAMRQQAGGQTNSPQDPTWNAAMSRKQQDMINQSQQQNGAETGSQVFNRAVGVFSGAINGLVKALHLGGVIGFAGQLGGQVSDMAGSMGGSSGSTAFTGSDGAATNAVGGAGAPASGGGGGGGGGNSGGVINAAMKFLGVPYKWGGTSPKGFDCSGLMQYVFKRFGVNLPRTAALQSRVGTPVSAAQAQPGDLLFFGQPVHHVGMYIGGGKMLNAPHTGAVVRIDSVNLSSCSAIRRVLGNSNTTSSGTMTQGVGSAGSMSVGSPSGTGGGATGGAAASVAHLSTDTTGSRIDSWLAGGPSLGLGGSGTQFGGSSASSGVGGGTGTSSGGDTTKVPALDGSISGPLDFAKALLKSVGAPLTVANVADMMAWEAQEGGNWHNSARYNPLNTTKVMHHPDSGKTGSQGNIGVYNSWAQGLAATSQTLMQPSYAAVRAALAKGDGSGVISAIESSPWGTKGISDPTAFYKQIKKDGVGYAKGSWDIEQDQWARVHAGEMVVPADKASKVRNASKGGGGNIYVTVTAQTITDSEISRLVHRLKDELGYDSIIHQIAST